jgi:hypothetical protein
MTSEAHPHRISEPKVVLLAAGVVLIGVLFIIAIKDTSDAWLVVVSVLAIAVVALAIVLDLRGVINDTGDYDVDAVPAPPGRSVVVCTGSMTAEQVLDALESTPAGDQSVMFVAPEGLGTGGLMVDKLDYERALRVETTTVAALRRAGINAAGHVGDRNPEHAIVDALALFPAGNVVIVAREEEAELYRRHLDVAALSRRTGANVQMREVVGI